jgi:hypothetical protein
MFLPVPLLLAWDIPYGHMAIAAQHRAATLNRFFSLSFVLGWAVD